MPGVTIHCDDEHTLPPPASVHNTDPDWTDLADAAAVNADLDSTEVLPPPPDIIDIDDDDILQVPIQQSTLLFSPMLPKIEPSPLPVSTPTSQTSRYPSQRDRCPPSRLQDCVFMTVADEGK